MKNAADKVVKLVKLVYNPFAFDIPYYTVVQYQVVRGIEGGEVL